MLQFLLEKKHNICYNIIGCDSMKTTILIIMVLFALLVILVSLYISIYNKLQKKLIRINEAECEIDETLRKRYDLLVQIESMINDATKLKQNNFKDIEKDTEISNFEFDRMLTKATNTFSKIWQDYPVELDKEEFRQLLTDLKINEEKNEASKSYYNKYTSELNELVKKFPSNIVASIHDIDERLYFDNKEMNDDNILDFKY